MTKHVRRLSQLFLILTAAPDKLLFLTTASDLLLILTISGRLTSMWRREMFDRLSPHKLLVLLVAVVL